MIRINIANDPSPSAESSTLAYLRTASWLHDEYVAPSWRVSNTRDLGRTATIDFDFMLANGTSLVDAASLYATVKEYAFWVRDPRYSRIDDAVTHKTMVGNLMYLAHALTIRDIWSFRHLQPYDIETLVEECRYGADAVTRASDRIQEFFHQIASDKRCSTTRFNGVPEYRNATTGYRTGMIDSGALLKQLCLPSGVKVIPRVAAAIGGGAVANGMRTPSGNAKAPELPPQTNQSVQAVQRWLDTLEQLYAMRRRLKAEKIDTIEFKPFPQGAAKAAAVKGVGTERTPIPPPKLALHLLEHAARWIFNPSKVSDFDNADREDILLLATACWIMIAAFSARRDEEIDDLRVGCIRGDAEGGWWLHVYIEKTLQRKEWIPVPSLVARAVELLQAISRSARARTGSDRLFQWLRSDGEVLRIDAGRKLDAFARAVAVPPHEPQNGPAVAWHWHPHQFRRFFAILYFYRFEGASIDALAHHLRHFDLNVTRGYTTRDPDVAALWTDVEWGYNRHYATTIAARERSVSGSAGERLKRMAKRLTDLLKRRLQVVTPDRIGAAVATIMQRQGMVLTPKPWVTCSCPNTADASRTAACRRGTAAGTNVIGPDFARAGPSVCPACPHALVERSRSSFVTAEVEQLEGAVASGSRAGTLFGALEEARVVELRQFEESYDDARPLNAVPEAEGASA
jgi:hypothetical protein